MFKIPRVLKSVPQKGWRIMKAGNIGKYCISGRYAAGVLAPQKRFYFHSATSRSCNEGNKMVRPDDGDVFFIQDHLRTTSIASA